MLLGAIFLLVWLAVVIYWQSTLRLPSETDLVLYLGVLPLALAGAAWGIFKLATRSPSLALVQVDAHQQAADVAQHDAEREREWTLNIVATSLHTAVGASSSEVLGKLKDGDMALELDPELKGPEGFAVFSARIPDLDDSDTQEAFAEWQKTTMHPDLQWSESQYRALHLAALSTHELASLASQHADVQRYVKQKEEGRSIKEDAVLPLRLIGLWPEHWSDAHQSVATGWLKTLVAEHGWPGHRIVVQEVKSEQANPIALLDSINVSSHRAQLPTIGILVACDSAIEQAHVDGLASQNKLFGGKNTQGARPGELAAGLLFADEPHSKLLGEGPFSRLHRASWADRDKSADERGRVSSDLLGRLVSLALDTSKVEVANVLLVSADNDHNPSRESELAEMLMAKFPDLDASQDAVKVAQACGSMHQMTTAAALCLAHQHVIDTQVPVLCASLHAPLLRAAVVLNVFTEKDIEIKSEMAKAA
jgi:hypothetical protein